MRQNSGNYTLPWHLWCPDSDLNWLKQPLRAPRKEEAKHSRSPAGWRLPQWEVNAKKTQHRGSDKKPSVLETRIAQNNSAESSRGSVSGRPLVKAGCPHSNGWRDTYLIKSQFLYNLSFLVSSNPHEQASGSGCSWGALQRLLLSVLKAPLSSVL